MNTLPTSSPVSRALSPFQLTMMRPMVSLFPRSIETPILS